MIEDFSNKFSLSGISSINSLDKLEQLEQFNRLEYLDQNEQKDKTNIQLKYINIHYILLPIPLLNHQYHYIEKSPFLEFNGYNYFIINNANINKQRYEEYFKMNVNPLNGDYIGVQIVLIHDPFTKQRYIYYDYYNEDHLNLLINDLYPEDMKVRRIRRYYFAALDSLYKKYWYKVMFDDIKINIINENKRKNKLVYGLYEDLYRVDIYTYQRIMIIKHKKIIDGIKKDMLRYMWNDKLIKRLIKKFKLDNINTGNNNNNKEKNINNQVIKIHIDDKEDKKLINKNS